MGNAEKRNCFGETEAEEEIRRRAIEDGKGRGRGRGKEKPPWRPLGIGELKVVPHECWADGCETKNGDPDCDTAIPKLAPVHCEMTMDGYAQDIIDRQDGDSYDSTEDEREANRDSEWDPNKVAEAGVNLMIELGLSPTPTRQMCDIVGAYMGRMECRMDGVIHYCLDNRRDEEVVKASLEFAGKMEKYFPEISKKAKARLIADAQMELQLQRRTDGPAYHLGEAIFGNRWQRLLRA